MDNSQTDSKPTANDDLLVVINAMSESGFSNVAEFLTAFFCSADLRVTKLVDRFMRDSFEDTMKLLMSKSLYGPTRRRTAKRAETLSLTFGKQLVDWVLKILSREFVKVAADSRAKLSPSNVS